MEQSLVCENKPGHQNQNARARSYALPVMCAYVLIKFNQLDTKNNAHYSETDSKLLSDNDRHSVK